LAELYETFAEIGLRVLGPSLEQLLECTELIARQSSGARDMIADTLRLDTSVRDVDAYRELVAGLRSSDAFKKGAAPAVNNQSLITCFEYRRRRLLFTGDMQFAKPEVEGLDGAMAALRESIQKAGFTDRTDARAGPEGRGYLGYGKEGHRLARVSDSLRDVLRLDVVESLEITTSTLGLHSPAEPNGRTIKNPAIRREHRCGIVRLYMRM
jgi:hypothetical protein